MKTIIAGSRVITDSKLVFDILNKLPFKITEVVCGEAPGVDLIGRDWAEEKGIPVKSMPANWNKYGLSAGPIRNQEMAEYGEALVLIWDGVSTGSHDMLKRARRMKLMVDLYDLSKNRLDF